MKDLAQLRHHHDSGQSRMGFAREVADRVLVMDVGSIIESGPPSQVFGKPQNPRTKDFSRRFFDGLAGARPVTVASGLALQPIDLKNQERNDVWVA